MIVLFYLKSLKVIIISAIIFLLFPASSYSQWFSQPLPVNGQVNDLKFFDGNTGLIAMWQPNIILRTTNGGYNWNTVYSTGRPAFELCMIDSLAVYVNSSTTSEYGMLLRSYNRGATWDSLPIANSWTVNGISFVNKDTGWVGGTAGGLPFLWRTTNAGVTWTVQSDDTGFGKVFFLKQKVYGEYVGWSQNYGTLWKTTNSGINWIQNTSVGELPDAIAMFFSDQFTGYISNNTKLTKT
ncbi:MAG: YCF48-related protein, partial [Candidatus Kapaibacterium sp.]